MPCSAYTLSLATIAAVISVALVAIAFSTDNWSRITVDRLKLEVRNKKKFFFFCQLHDHMASCVHTASFSHWEGGVGT